MSMELDALPFPQGIFVFPPVHCHSKVSGGRHSHAYLGTLEELFPGHSRIVTWATTCQHQSNRTSVTARKGWHARFGASVLSRVFAITSETEPDDSLLFGPMPHVCMGKRNVN